VVAFVSDTPTPITLGADWPRALTLILQCARVDQHLNAASRVLEVALRQREAVLRDLRSHALLIVESDYSNPEDVLMVYRALRRDVLALVREGDDT
jgi:hypothetical protein